MRERERMNVNEILAKVMWKKVTSIQIQKVWDRASLSLRVIWFQATESSGFRAGKPSRGVKLEMISQTWERPGQKGRWKSEERVPRKGRTHIRAGEAEQEQGDVVQDSLDVTLPLAKFKKEGHMCAGARLEKLCKQEHERQRVTNMGGYALEKGGRKTGKMSQAVSMSPILQMGKLSKLVLELGFNLSFCAPKVCAPSPHCAVINSHLNLGELDQLSWVISWFIRNQQRIGNNFNIQQ